MRGEMRSAVDEAHAVGNAADVTIPGETLKQGDTFFDLSRRRLERMQEAHARLTEHLTELEALLADPDKD